MNDKGSVYVNESLRVRVESGFANDLERWSYNYVEGVILRPKFTVAFSTRIIGP